MNGDSGSEVPDDNSTNDIFASAPVPSHKDDFWVNVEAGALDRSERPLGVSGIVDDEAVNVPIRLEKLSDGGNRDRHRRVASFFSIAAVSLLVIGGLFVANAQRSRTNSITAESTNEDQTFRVDDFVDFSGEHKITVLGSGSPRAVNASGTAVLIVDDAPGNTTGCGETELVTIYSQRFDSSDRSQILPEDVVIKPERVEVNLENSEGKEILSWTDYCDSERRATWTGQLSSDAQEVSELNRLGTFTIGGLDDPVFGEIRSTFGDSVLAESADRRRAMVASPNVVVTEIEDRQICAHVAPEIGSTDVANAAAWAPDNTTVAIAFESEIVVWNCVTGDQKSIEAVVADERLLFDPTGSRLLFQSMDNDNEAQVSVVSFG